MSKKSGNEGKSKRVSFHGESGQRVSAHQRMEPLAPVPESNVPPQPQLPPAQPMAPNNPPPPPDPKQRTASVDLKGFLAHKPISSSAGGADKTPKIKTRDLQTMKGRLKKAHEIRKQVDLRREELFDKYMKYSYLPLVDVREYIRLQTIRQEVVSISFDGIEQLTDLFFYTLNYCQVPLEQVKWLSLMGCYNVTDEGVYWISQTFPNLLCISLDGCKKVTEKSLFYLRNGPKDSDSHMETVMAYGTNIGMMPDDGFQAKLSVDKITNRLRSSVAGQNVRAQLDVYVSGCPMISPLSTEIKDRLAQKADVPRPAGKPALYRKMVILVPDDLPWDPLAVMCGDPNVAPKKGLQVKNNWKPFAGHKTIAENQRDLIFNVFQVSETFSELVVTKGSLVVLPYHLHKGMPDSLAADLLQTVTSIMVKHEDCSIALWGLTDGKDKVLELAVNIERSVQKGFEQIIKRLQDTYKESLQYNWKMADLEFAEQLLMGACMKFVIEDRVKHLVEAISSATMVVGGAKAQGADMLVVQNLLRSDAMFPWNRMPLQCDKVVGLSQKLSTNQLKLAHMSEIDLDSLQMPNVDSAAKLFSYSELWGHAMVYRKILPARNQLIITDFRHLSDVFTHVLQGTAPRSCDLRCLATSKVPCWTQDDLMKKLPGDALNKVPLLDWLEEDCHFLRLAVDVWSSPQETSSVYVQYHDLPTEKPQILGEYWPDLPPTMYSMIERFYLCYPGLPSDFFPSLLRNLFKLGGPTLLWKDGALFEKAYMTILVEKLVGQDGLPVIVVQLRYNDSVTRMLSEGQVWSTLKLYTGVVDHLVIKYNIPALQCVACGNCRKDMSNAAVVQAPIFTQQAHVRGNKEHLRVCLQCNNSIVREKMVTGPLPGVTMSSLVAKHNMSGRALNTSNPLNRCLMCQNCAIEGTDCPVNLTRGTKNMMCDCEGRGKLCVYCGMCQRCHIFLREIASTIEPRFESEKLERFQMSSEQFLDEVKKSEKGSVISLLEKQACVELDHTLLSPNHCPNLEICLLNVSEYDTSTQKPIEARCQEITFSLKLQSTQNPGLEMAFNTLTNIVKFGEETVQIPAKHAMKWVGDTVAFSLNYVHSKPANFENLFTTMALTMMINGTPVFEREITGQTALVSLINETNNGVVLQVRAQQKFRHLVDNNTKKTNCGAVVAKLPCAMEMKTYQLLENIDHVCFGGKGVSLSGSPCLLLPRPITAEMLRYPRISQYTDLSLYNLCLTWNPLQGKKKSIGTPTNKPNLNNPLADRVTYDDWTMNKLIHLVNGEGIPAADLKELTLEDQPYVFWLWHFILTTYPEMLFPEKTDKVFPALQEIMDTKALQVKEGFRLLLKTTMWHNFSKFDFDYMKRLFGTSYYRGEYLSTKNQFLQFSLNLQELTQEHIDKTGLLAIQSKYNRSLTLCMCASHVCTIQSQQLLSDITPQLYGVNGIFVSFADFSNNDLTVIPDEFFTGLPNLVDLRMGHNFIEVLPATIGQCKKLMNFMIHENNLTELPEELGTLKHIKSLEIGANRFPVFPQVITKLTSLEKLTMQNMCLGGIPEDIGELVNLKSFAFHGNCITKLPESFTKLVNLEQLFLDGVKWLSPESGKETMHSFKFAIRKRFGRWLEHNHEQSTQDLFNMFDNNKNGVLEANELGKFNAAVYNIFPRLGYKGKELPVETTPHGFPMEILSCRKLKMLYLNYQGITKLPPEIRQLEELVELQLNHMPYLLSIPAELSDVTKLKRIELDDCPMLKTPPREIRDKGMTSIMAYLQRLLGGAMPSKRTKLMLVGLGGAGKTSLVKSMLSSTGKADLEKGDDITDGIDISTWQVKHEDDQITYNIWDFAGQTVYYNTHQFFLSPNRAIYLLLWNVRLGHEHAGLEFWLSSITVQAPKTPIFVVGTHIDQVSKSDLHIEELQQKFPQIVAVHYVSSYTGQGVSDLKKKLFDVTLQQQYMGEHIPAVWLTFENNIAWLKSKDDILPYSRLEEVANTSGIFDPAEVYQAVQFLHDLGSVQYFANEYLKSKVVINPQWIVDVMACVVSVKNNIIQEGRLKHCDLEQIWHNYPQSLHRWLLRLTEEFNLSFELKNEPVNLVPCLMSEIKPKFTWPELDHSKDVRETKMVYTFDYLPAGLFNRVQVRLHHLSDSALIWRKGSFLKKNVHLALLQQTKDRELVVLAQGPRPENIQFLVHEVFEGLIAESFNGVTYDFTMPCPECQKMGVTDVHMFAASTIRRALDMKAPFLQCIKYFHTISCVHLQTLLPPDNHNDFDVHLVQCVQGLKDLHRELAADIFISYCEPDGRLDGNQYILPSRVQDELINKGYKCFRYTKDNPMTTDEMAKALIDSSVFLAFVSMNYAQDEECVNIFKYARLTLKKTIVVIAIGANFDWKQSTLGILLSDEVFINMTKSKYEYFDSKFNELLKALEGKTRVVSDFVAKPAVFFSYTWVNSAQAVKLGTKELPGAIGDGDPRELKTYLEDKGINCWIDVERVGMNGLFDDIAAGLLSAKVVVVCVSDEYAASPTCQIEFRYASNILKLPLVMAVVGTGDAWRATEVGLMSVYYPIVNFQEKTKGAKHKLLSLVQSKLGEVTDSPDGPAVPSLDVEQNKDLSYQELFELAQRKLLRQLMIFEENQEMDVYPRLFVLDFLADQETSEYSTDEDGPTEEKEVDKPKKVLKHRATSSIVPLFKLQKYCVYTLCEHEEGWHSAGPPLILPSDFGMESIDMFCPFLSRMTTIMKYNKKLALQCLSDEAGESYLEWLEKSSDANMSDYQMVYHKFREFIQSMDEERVMGNLQRCHLTDGKTIWLCDKHRTSSKVTTLGKAERISHTTAHISKENEQKLNEYMLVELCTMDYSPFEGEYTSKGLAKRSILEMSKSNRHKDPKAGKKSKHHKGKKGKIGASGEEEANDGSNATGDPSDDPTSSEKGGKKTSDSKSNKSTKEVSFAGGLPGLFDETKVTTGRQDSETGSVTSEAPSESGESVTGPIVSGSMRHRQQQKRTPLPGQSKYKVPGYKQTSRACEIS